LAPLRFNSPIVTQVLGSDRRMRRLSSALGAADLRFISGYVSVKNGPSGPLWWHQDWWCWDHPVTRRAAASQVAILCYLSDTDHDSAALRVLPGTHHRSVALHADLPEAHGRQADQLDATHPAMSDHPEQLTLACHAGDAVALDYRLLHGTHPNRSRARRDALILTFAPDWRTLPDDIRAHLIRHPALPGPGEQTTPELAVGLPDYAGRPRDLTLRREAPARFAVRDSSPR
jgi:ectoine hydroxylase-related dioxygenase (phytanoyl-CoA dioxygenase family)